MVVTSSPGFTTFDDQQFWDLEAVEKHPPSVVSSVLDESTVMDSTHAVRVKIAADDAHGEGRVAVRVDDVQGRPPVALDMTLADSDNESSVSVPQSEAVSSNQRKTMCFSSRCR